MCGRFVLARKKRELEDHFDLESEPETPAHPGLIPRYNIAPTQTVWVVRAEENQRRLRELRWGLVPRWASDPGMAAKLINARSETLAEKPSFRDAFRHRRCLIPAIGFYEWKAGDRTQPQFIQYQNGELFAFAGLWESWKSPVGQVLETCCIITTSANETLRPLHERMPVIIDPQNYSHWLDPHSPAEELQKLFLPHPAPLWSYYPVAPRVNKVALDDPSLLERLAEAPPQPMQRSLFD